MINFKKHSKTNNIFSKSKKKLASILLTANGSTTKLLEGIIGQK